MIYCPSCGTANRDGSRFCNECGTKLPTMTSSLCPTCGTPNPPHTIFCEKCGARLIPSLAEESEESEAHAPSAVVPKGLSLPTKSTTEPEPAVPAPVPDQPPKPVVPALPVEEDLPDWLQVVQSAAADTPESDIAKGTTANDKQQSADQAAPDEVPEWLSELGLDNRSSKTKKSQTDELLPDWARRLRSMPEATQPPAEEEEVPDWLKTLGTTGQLPSTAETSNTPTPAEPAAPPPWSAGPEASSELPASDEEDLPEWIKEPPSPYFSAAPSETPSPSTAQTPSATEDMPDWLRDLRPASSAEDALPDWLDELGVEEQPASESTALSTGDDALDWLSQLGATTPEQPVDQGAVPEIETQPMEEIPEWLRNLEAEPAPPETPTAGTTSEPQKPVTDWLSALRQATPEIEAEQAQAEDEIPEWLREESGAAPQAIGGLQAYDQEAPGWPHEAGAVAGQPAASTEEEIPEWLRATQAASESTEPQPSAQPEEGMPDWLKGLGVTAAGAAAVGSFEEEQPQEPAASEQPPADWLSALRLATPEMEAEQASEEEEPEWQREESGAAPQAIGGVQSYDQEIPDWLREAGVILPAASAAGEEETFGSLSEPQATAEAAEAQPLATPEEEGIPDWLKGLGVAAAGAAAIGAFTEEQPPKEAEPQKAATDWLTTLRRATPEMEAEQGSEEAEPEWLREESGAAPQAIGGQQAYDQEVPDWLREESGVASEAAQPPVAAGAEEEEGVPDWLKGLGAATIGAAAVGATSRAEETSDEGLPDWLRETEPAPAAAVETPPSEEAAPVEMPEWLRELTPAAAVVAAKPEAKAPEEIQQAEGAAEVKPEEESWVSKAVPVAAAGMAAAAAAGAVKKSEQAEATPAEMPEWLKEIRQEQQVAKTAIPVPPPEPTGLTQAEIPAWLEALRPKEEAAAPKEAETPSETEGPLAGIANALPPAPIMGEMHGLPAKLQYAVSAEDQARAGVLTELLSQHAVAPASVEQFVVKGSAINRRALRWIVAFLIIAALFVPVGFDLNQLTGLPLLPNAQKMIIPPTVGQAAYEISRLAQLPPNSKVLIVFDYDASQAGELNRVASALLKSPALRTAQIQVTSLNAQGSAMAQSVLTSLPNIRYSDLGFVPGQANGVQSLLANYGDVKLIIELAASPETVRWWAEHLKANRSEVPLVVGVSAGAEPLTMPYVQSGQVSGLVSGLPGSVAFLNATGMMNTYSQDQIKDYQIPLEALTLANYVMVGLIIVGLIVALLRGTGRRSA